MEQAAQIVIGGLVQGSVFAVVALGIALVYRVTGVINLAQGGFCILGALLYYSAVATLGWPPVPAALGAVAATTALGFALGAASFVPALAHLPNSSMLMLTAGLMTVIEGLVLVLWGSEPYAVPPFSGEAPLVLLGIRVPSQGPWIAGSSALIILAVWVPAGAYRDRQGAARLRREPDRGAADGRRRAAPDLAELRLDRADRRASAAWWWRRSCRCSSMPDGSSPTRASSRWRSAA
ncbi:MAG: branched-chain amino acid ABC transporter permease [Pseudomonadota bacterium]